MLFPAPVLWSTMPNCMSGRAFSGLERILLAIGFDKGSLNILIADCNAGGGHARRRQRRSQRANVADRILKSFLDETSKFWCTSIVRLTALPAQHWQQISLDLQLIFNDDRSRGTNSTARHRSPTPSATPQPAASTSKKLKVNGHRTDARSSGSSAELKQGSKANLVT